jgi:hypothetical protein
VNTSIPANLPLERMSWLRLPPKQGKRGTTEGAVAYEAFQNYFTTAPGARSLRQVAATVRKSETLIERWSSRFDWVERTKAWDYRQTVLRNADIEKQNEQQHTTWATREQELREQKFQIGQQLVSRAKRMLEHPLTIRTVTKSDGSGQQNITINPVRWTHDSTLRTIQTGIALTEESIKTATDSQGLAAEEWIIGDYVDRQDGGTEI